MPIKDVVKVSRKTFFNPSGWLGYNFLKAQFRITKDLLKDTFTPATPQRKETFQQAVKRLNLTEEDIKQREQNYLLYALFLAACGIVAFIFSGYLVFYYGSISGLILGLGATALFFVYAFRYHFWYFQTKNRKLGCTFDEWLHGIKSSREDPKP